MTLSRRSVLSALALTPVLAVVGCGGDIAPPAPKGARPLPIPPLADSNLDGGVRRFRLRAQTGETEIRSGITTPTWGYSGDILGPTLRARHGEQIAVTVDNALPEPTTVHWHGMHLPARFDGGPHQTLQSGQSWNPEWRIDQPAATLWYHPHPHGRTQHQAYRGLAGFFLLDDDASDRVGLPNSYGVDDIPLVIQDKKFTPDGHLDETDDTKLGLLGNTVTANGIADAYLRARTRRIRLRLLNGSTMRLYNLGLDNDAEFAMVAGDGGLLEHPVPLQRIQLTPGERAEIILTLRPGERRTLRAFAFPDTNGIIARPGIPDFGLGDTFDVLAIQADTQLGENPAVPTHLIPATPLDTSSGATRTFDLQPTAINGATMDMDRIDFTTTLGATEIWSVTNNLDWVHNFHVHDTMFRILDINGQPPPPELSGWKDTVNVRPYTTVRLALRFDDYADPQWPYMYHCHLMFHEDLGMMGQFLVLPTAPS